MLEKLLLAVIITFSLNLFLGVRLPSKTQIASSSYLAPMPTTLREAAGERTSFLAEPAASKLRTAFQKLMEAPPRN